MSGRTTVLADPESLALAAARRIVEIVTAIQEAKGQATLVLSGGSTPALTYSKLPDAGTAAGVEWKSLHLFWGDERCVPPDDYRSNYRLVKESLLRHVEVPGRNIHRMRGELSPSAAASAYEADLRASFRMRKDSFPEFDLIMLGLGPDGHIASLFPGSSELEERTRMVVPVKAAEGPERLSLTLPVINSASRILMIVSGKQKAEVVRSVLEQSGDALPAQKVKKDRVEWLLDRTAASLLKGIG